MDSRGSSVYGFIGAFVPISLVMVCVRLYTRRKFSFLSWDDLAIVVSLIFYLSVAIGFSISAYYGLGRHVRVVGPENTFRVFKTLFVSQILYPPALAAVKLSITLFLLRVLPSVHKWIVPLYCIAGVVVIQGTCAAIVLALQCRPVAFYWDKTLHGRCINQEVFYYVDSSLSIALDVVILSLPWILFHRLQIPRIKKYGVVIICSLGIFTLGTSVARLPFIVKLARSKDPTWDILNVCIWIIAELGSAITLSSIPVTMPLIRHHFPNFMPSTMGMTSKEQDRRSRSQQAVFRSLKTPHQDETSMTCLQLDDFHASASSVEDYSSKTGIERQIEG